VLRTSPSSDAYLQMMQIVDRLLILGVGDDLLEVRLKVFMSFTPAVDHIISQSENMHCLIEGLSDESVEVRAAAMALLCRVAHYDELRIMPLVRLNMKTLIRQLHNAKDKALKQESVQLLQAMVRGSNTLIVPYVKQVLEPLMTLINDSSSTVVGSALLTIAELAFASPESVKEYLDDIFAILIKALNDDSSIIKQDIAVAAIGKLVPALTMAIEEPYTKYPGLLEGLVRTIQFDQEDSSLRQEAIRTAGLLGAPGVEVYQARLRRAKAADMEQYAVDDSWDKNSAVEKKDDIEELDKERQTVVPNEGGSRKKNTDILKSFAEY
jgi:hypothetical protein